MKKLNAYKLVLILIIFAGQMQGMEEPKKSVFGRLLTWGSRTWGYLNQPTYSYLFPTPDEDLTSSLESEQESNQHQVNFGQRAKQLGLNLIYPYGPIAQQEQPKEQGAEIPALLPPSIDSQGAQKETVPSTPVAPVEPNQNHSPEQAPPLDLPKKEQDNPSLTPASTPLDPHTPQDQNANQQPNPPLSNPELKPSASHSSYPWFAIGSGVVAAGLVIHELWTWSSLSPLLRDIKQVKRLIKLSNDNELTPEQFEGIVGRLSYVSGPEINAMRNQLIGGQMVDPFLENTVIDNLYKKHANVSFAARLRYGFNYRMAQIKKLANRAWVTLFGS